MFIVLCKTLINLNYVLASYRQTNDIGMYNLSNSLILILDICFFFFDGLFRLAFLYFVLN